MQASFHRLLSLKSNFKRSSLKLHRKCLLNKFVSQLLLIVLFCFLKYISITDSLMPYTQLCQYPTVTYKKLKSNIYSMSTNIHFSSWYDVKPIVWKEIFFSDSWRERRGGREEGEMCWRQSNLSSFQTVINENEILQFIKYTKLS